MASRRWSVWMKNDNAKGLQIYSWEEDMNFYLQTLVFRWSISLSVDVILVKMVDSSIKQKGKTDDQILRILSSLTKRTR